MTDTATTNTTPHTPTDAEVEALLAALGGRIEYEAPQPVTGYGARSSRKGFVTVRASIYGIYPHMPISCFSRRDAAHTTYLHGIFEGRSPEDARALARRSVVYAFRGHVSYLAGEVESTEARLAEKRAEHARYVSALALAGAST